MAGRLTALAVTIVLVSGACSTDDPLAAAPTGTDAVASSTTTTLGLPSSLPPPPRPSEEPACHVVETAARPDDTPTPPEFADARLEAGLADRSRAWAVFDDTIWLAQDDSAPGGEPTGGPVRVLTADPETCSVHDLTVLDDDLYAIACQRETSADCSLHRVDARTGETSTSKPADAGARFIDNDELLLVSEPFRFRALHVDLTDRWSKREPLTNSAFATENAIWFNDTQGRRLDPHTGDELDPFDPDDRVLGVAGDLVAVVDTVIPDSLELPPIRLLDGNLEEQNVWDAAAVGLLEPGQLIGNGLMVTQGEGGSPFRIGLVDIATGDLAPIADFSGEPVSRGGASIIEWLDLVDHRLWFWWESSIWSLPAPSTARCRLEVINVPAVEAAAPPVSPARLEYPIEVGFGAQPVVLDALWVAYADRPDTSGPSVAGVRGIVPSDPAACSVRDMTTQDGFVFVIVCVDSQPENTCEQQRVDSATDSVDRVAPTRTVDWVRDSPALVASGDGIVESLDSELRMQWRTEGRLAQPVVSDSFVWSANPTDGRFELATGAHSDVALPESDRVVAAEGEVVVVGTDTGGGVTTGRFVTEDLAQAPGREPWTIRFSGTFTSTSSWRANPFIVGLDDNDPDNGRIILASIDLLTGSVVQYGSHVSASPSGGDSAIPPTVAAVDDRIWFVADGGIWSVPR